jgi:hypothetical protein
MNRLTLLLQLSVEPIPTSPAAEGASGGIANVWVLGKDEPEAIALAEHELKEAGWRVLGHEEPVRRVTADDFAIGSVGRQRFCQCQHDGMVIQLHTWRAEH